jgi:hypothetical protein
MSFGFTAVGDREQVIDQLADAPGDDPLKTALAELIAEHVSMSELHGYEQAGTTMRQVYVVEAAGHSGPQSALSLTVSIKTPYIPVAGLPEAAADPDDED